MIGQWSGVASFWLLVTNQQSSKNSQLSPRIVCVCVCCLCLCALCREGSLVSFFGNRSIFTARRHNLTQSSARGLARTTSQQVLLVSYLSDVFSLTTGRRQISALQREALVTVISLVSRAVVSTIASFFHFLFYLFSRLYLFFSPHLSSFLSRFHSLILPFLFSSPLFFLFSLSCLFSISFSPRPFFLICTFKSSSLFLSLFFLLSTFWYPLFHTQSLFSLLRLCFSFLFLPAGTALL